MASDERTFVYFQCFDLSFFDWWMLLLITFTVQIFFVLNLLTKCLCLIYLFPFICPFVFIPVVAEISIFIILWFDRCKNNHKIPDLDLLLNDLRKVYIFK